jgi:hypothetical protein
MNMLIIVILLWKIYATKCGVVIIVVVGSVIITNLQKRMNGLSGILMVGLQPSITR